MQATNAVRNTTRGSAGFEKGDGVVEGKVKGREREGGEGGSGGGADYVRELRAGVPTQRADMHSSETRGRGGREGGEWAPLST